MKAPELPTIFPPADLLEQVEGVERGLRQRRRLGALGVAGVLLSTLQLLVLLLSNDWLWKLIGFNWEPVGRHWLELTLAFSLIGSVLLVLWTRFWLKESRTPFRYTYWIDDFAPVATTPSHPSLAWLRYDLERQLAERIGRLSRRDERSPGANGAEGAAGGAGAAVGGGSLDAHIHVSGEYLIRWENGAHHVEVTPRVRIGPPGRPETLAHSINFKLKPGNGATKTAPNTAANAANPGATGTAPAHRPEPANETAGGEEPSNQPPQPTTAQQVEKQDDRPIDISRDQYDKLFERVYHSVASQIYAQIRQDVQRKIDLLPTSYFRATAYFYEADDYARSNTFDAYEEARKLYERAIQIYDPGRRLPPRSRWPRTGFRLLLARARLVGWWRRRAARVWPSLGRVEVMVARAETGYANMLCYRRNLALLSGRRMNPIFEARAVARSAVDRLLRLPDDVPDRTESLFDAYVALAQVYALTSETSAVLEGAGPPTTAAATDGNWRDDLMREKARGRAELAAARRLQPGRADQDARYLYVAGLVEPSPRIAEPLYRSAAELDPKFELAPFELANWRQVRWQQRSVLDPNVARAIIADYERVLEINPGNVAACANIGYMQWLLVDPGDRGAAEAAREAAKDAFERGREYKDLRPETFVAEIDLGLARIAAEREEFDDAYRYYVSATDAWVAAYGATGSSYEGLSAVTYSYHTNPEIWQRFDRYCRDVAAHRAAADPNGRDRRIRDVVYAFALYDFGLACDRYAQATGDGAIYEQALAAFEESVDLLRTHGGNYVLPLYHLYLVKRWHWHPARQEQALQHILEIGRLEPRWPEGQWGVIEGMIERYRRLPDEVIRARADASNRKRDALRLNDELRPARLEFHAAGLAATPPVLGSVVGTGTGSSLAATLGELLPNQMRQKKVRLDQEARTLQERVTNFEAAVDEILGSMPRLLRQLVPHAWLWLADGDDPIAGFAAPGSAESHRSTWPMVIAARRATVADRLRRRPRQLATDPEPSAPPPPAYVQLLLQPPTAVARRLDTELDDVHVKTLFTWCRWLMLLNEPTATRLGDALRRRFGEVDRDLVVACRDKAEAAAKSAYDAILRSTAEDVLTTYASSVSAFDLVLHDPSFSREEKLTRLRQASRERSWSASQYRWLGDRLADMYREYPGIASAAAMAGSAGATEPLATPAGEAARTGAIAAHVRAAIAAARSDSGQAIGAAQGLEALGSWEDCLKAYFLAMARLEQEGEPDGRAAECHRGIGRALWALGRHEAAIAELDEAAAGGAALASDWRTALVRDLLFWKQVDSRQRYWTLKTWLARQVEPDGEQRDPVAAKDAVRARLLLVRDTYRALAWGDRAAPGEPTDDLPVVTPIVLEADARLFPQRAETEAVVRMIAQDIPQMRERIEASTGIAVPGVRIRANQDLREGDFVLLLYEIPRLRGNVLADGYRRAIAPEPSDAPVDPYGVMLSHLELLLRQHVASLLGHQEVRGLVEGWVQAEPAGRRPKVDRALPDVATWARFGQVLRRLADEGVPIRRLDIILDRFGAGARADGEAPGAGDLGELVERVRLALAEAGELPGNDGSRRLIGLSPGFEAEVGRQVRAWEGKRFLALPPETADKLRGAVRARLADQDPATVALLVRQPGLRPFVRRLTERDFRAVPVLAEAEAAEELEPTDDRVEYAAPARP